MFSVFIFWMLTEKPRQSSGLCTGSLLDDKLTEEMYKDDLNQSLQISNIFPSTSSFLCFYILPFLQLSPPALSGPLPLFFS